MNAYIKDHRKFIKPPYLNELSINGEKNGLSWTVDVKGVVTFNGKPTSDMYFIFKEFTEETLPKGKYKFTDIDFIEVTQNGNWIKGINTHSIPVQDIDYSYYDKIVCYIACLKDKEFVNTVVKPQIEFVGGVNLYIKSDKNLFDPVLYKPCYYQGIRTSINGDEITMIGTALKSIYVSLISANTDAKIPVPDSWKGKTISLYNYQSGNYTDSTFEMGIYATDGSAVFINNKNPSGYCSEDAVNMFFRVRFSEGLVYNERFKFMVCEGEKDNTTPYTPYGYQKVKVKI